jgi:hypothetical protein
MKLPWPGSSSSARRPAAEVAEAARRSSTSVDGQGHQMRLSASPASSEKFAKEYGQLCDDIARLGYLAISSS